MNLLAGFIIFILVALTCVLGVLVFKSVKSYKNSENIEQRESYEPIILHLSRKNDFKSRVIRAFHYVPVSSPDTGVSADITLEQGKNVFGRSAGLSDYVIDDKSVSRIHFVIYVNKDRMIIEDCKSANGTLLNGKKLGTIPRYLNIGDEICAGKTRFIVGEIAE